MKELPLQVKEYHNLVPLDSQQINIDHKSRTFSYQTIIVETWKKIQHANICTLRDVFGTKEFNGDHCKRLFIFSPAFSKDKVIFIFKFQY